MAIQTTFYDLLGQLPGADVAFDDLFGRKEPVRYTAHVVLNEVECNLVRDVAEKRIAYCRANYFRATPTSGVDPMYKEVNYYGAEVASCRIHNTYPDTSYDLAEVYDWLDAYGNRVDTKWTKYLDGACLVKKTQKVLVHPPKYFVFTFGELPEYWYIGFMLARDLMVDERLVEEIPIGNGRVMPLAFPNWYARQDELTFERV